MGADSDADRVEAPDDAPPGPEHTWLYAEEAQLAAPLRTTASSRVTYTSVGGSPTRPFASNVATPGAMIELGGEVGILPRVAIAASGVGAAGGAETSLGAVAGIRVALLPDAWTATRAVASAGYLRELSGGNGAWGRLALTQDIGSRLRLAAAVHGEHVFLAGRDGLDVMAVLGANVEVARHFRAGVEYVGQDLEESLDDEAEGGVRHFLGPSAALALLDGRLSLTGGPAFGLSASSPRVLGRLAIAWNF